MQKLEGQYVYRRIVFTNIYIIFYRMQPLFETSLRINILDLGSGITRMRREPRDQ